MKNENGTGSIYKLKGKRRRPWVVRVTTGYSIDGRQKRKLIGTFETKREAQEVLFNYNKNPLLFSQKTFGEIRENWWNNYQKKIKSKKTISTNLYRIEKLKALDDFKMVDIKLFMLQDLFDNLDTSWSFKNGCKSILNMIFDYALKNDFVSENKVRFIEIGKKEKVLERKIFSKKEIDILWENVNSKYVYIVLILIYTGMRIGELINLKNSDIDLENEIIYIRISKTEAGERIIPIHSKILYIIQQNIVPNQEYFVKGDTTNQLSYSTFKPRFLKLLKSLGIQKHTIHDTRHTFATLLNNCEANSTSIIKLIGHSDFSTTQNVYTHKDTEELRKAINLLN